jgi:hypothetical protein
VSRTFAHGEIEQLLGAFALDALDEDERDVVETHLLACPRCRAEVAGYRETAAMLAHSGTPAPEGVWTRITEALDEAPPEVDLARIAPFGHPTRTPRWGRRSISLRAAAATVAVAAAFAAFIGIRVSDQDERIGELTKLLEGDSLRRAALAAMGAPDADDVSLRSSDGRWAARVVVLPGGRGYVVADNLRGLPSDRTYQLWALRQDARISLGVLGRDPDVAAFPIDGPVFGFAITEEQAGGVVSTDQPPVVVGWKTPPEDAGAI